MDLSHVLFMIIVTLHINGNFLVITILISRCCLPFLLVEIGRTLFLSLMIIKFIKCIILILILLLPRICVCSEYHIFQILFQSLKCIEKSQSIYSITDIIIKI